MAARPNQWQALSRPTTQRTALGATTILNEGMVFFACSAFAPGASVTVIAIPTAGSNFTKTFNSATLAMLQPGAAVALQPPATMRTANDLIGSTEAVVRGRIGEPQAIDGSRWT